MRTRLKKYIDFNIIFLSLLIFVSSLGIPSVIVSNALGGGISVSLPPITDSYVAMSSDDLRQKKIIRARIMSRLGCLLDALKLYESLRKEFPEDLEIWEDHIELLMDMGEYEKAQHELRELLDKNPDSLRGQRLRARMYMELKRYRWAYPVFEKILTTIYRRDVSLWRDYAYAREAGGDWAGALHYFRRVLEIEPEDTDAIINIQRILREHRPTLESEYRIYKQDTDDSQTRTLTLRFRQFVNPSTLIKIIHQDIHVNIPQQEFVAFLSRDYDFNLLELNHELMPGIWINMGGGFMTGAQDGGVFTLGFDLVKEGSNNIRLKYSNNFPWYDPMEATRHKGTQDIISGSIEWFFLKDMAFFLGLEERIYSLEGIQKYGVERSYNIILSRRLLTDPYISISYSYGRSRFRYDDQNHMPIAMIESEGIHSFLFDATKWLNTWLELSFSGSIGRDYIREIDSWYINPRIKFRLKKRLIGQISWQKSSEAGVIEGGKTDTWVFSIRFVF